MDTKLNSVTYTVQNNYFGINSAIINITLFKRDKSFKFSHLYKARESDYYIKIEGPSQAVQGGSLTINVDNEPEEKFASVCFYWYRLSYKTHRNCPEEALGMSVGVLASTLGIGRPYHFNPSTNAFKLYLSCNERDRDYLAKNLSRISGVDIAPSYVYKLKMVVTNSRVTLNEVLGYTGDEPNLKQIAEIKNAGDFIDMTIGCSFAYNDSKWG